MMRAHPLWLTAAVLAVAGCRPAAGPVEAVTRAGAAGSHHPGDSRPTTDETRWRAAGSDGPDGSRSAGGRGPSQAAAVVDLRSNPGIHLRASATAAPNGCGHAAATGQWVDLVRVAANDPPDALRVRVEVSGVLTLDPAEADAVARVGVSALAGAELLADTHPVPVPACTIGTHRSNLYADADAGWEPGGCPSTYVGTTAADGLRGCRLVADPNRRHGHAGPGPAGGAVCWHADFDLPYSADLGGYRLNLYATAHVHARAGSAAAFDGTVRLTRVGLPDGSPAPTGLTFASGFVPPADR